MGKAPSTARAAASLKEQKRASIWAIIAVNLLFLYTVYVSDSIIIIGRLTVLAAASNLLPVGLAGIVATLLNGILSADSKASLVYLRRRDALPGSRAFSLYARSDPRIDVASLEKLLGSPLPSNPQEQNRAWYKLYRQMEGDPAVIETHRNFLLLRDYAGLSALFVPCLGAIGLYSIRSTAVWSIYVVLLLVQFAVARQAAAQYGVRMVTNVLARIVPLPSGATADRLAGRSKPTKKKQV
jgi:hypothetical protein